MTAPLPPMCPGTRLLGHARALLDDTAGAVATGYRTCGPVFRMRAAWRRFTFIAGPEAEEVFARRLDETHVSRHRIFKDVEREFGPCRLVLAHGGDTHARLRTLLALAFSRQVASPRVPAMSDAIRTAIRRWPAGRPLGVVRQTKSLSLVAYATLLGLEDLAFDDWNLVTNYMMNVTAGQVPPVVFRAPWYRRAHGRNGAVLRTALADQRANSSASTPPTVLQALAAARSEDTQPLSDDEVLSYAAYGVGASIGYVGRLAAFLLYEILRDALLKDAVVAEAHAVFADGLVDARDVRRMPVLRSAYFETLRVHPFAIGMPFDVDTPFEFHGHTVAPGARLIVSPVPMSFSSTDFPDPHRFDASRCREPRNEHRGGGLRPFGLAHRTCSAMGLVEVMTLTLMATLLHERTLDMSPSTYRLRRSVWPLPSPDRRFRMTATPIEGATRGAVAAPAPDDDVFATFPGHADPAVRALLGAAVRRTYAPGDAIVREGEAPDACYLVERGSVRVTRDNGAITLAALTTGEWFGETGLITDQPRNATVVAGETGATTRVLGRDAFLAMITGSDLVAGEIAALLRRRAASARLCDALAQLTAEARVSLLPELRPRTYRVGDLIVREGAPADEFFVIAAGEVEVRRRGAEGAEIVVARLDPGEYFGEVGLIRGTPRNASVVASGSRDVEVLVTDVEGFERMLAGAGGRGGELAMAMLARVESSSN